MIENIRLQVIENGHVFCDYARMVEAPLPSLAVKGWAP
jgi:hypothetical protein